MSLGVGTQAPRGCGQPGELQEHVAAFAGHGVACAPAGVAQQQPELLVDAFPELGDAIPALRREGELLPILAQELAARGEGRRQGAASMWGGTSRLVTFGSSGSKRGTWLSKMRMR